MRTVPDLWKNPYCLISSSSKKDSELVICTQSFLYENKYDQPYVSHTHRYTYFGKRKRLPVEGTTADALEIFLTKYFNLYFPGDKKLIGSLVSARENALSIEMTTRANGDKILLEVPAHLPHTSNFGSQLDHLENETVQELLEQSESYRQIEIRNLKEKTTSLYQIKE